MKKVGLALGGGGAKGLAHIPVLEVFDEMGIVPTRIAGTSIGAIIGALYASGMRGAEIRKSVDELIRDKDESLLETIRDREISRTLKFFDVDLRHGGLLRGDRVLKLFEKLLKVNTFEELKIPLSIIATDYYKASEVVLEKGDLLSAIRASMGLPGVFTPIEREGKILIDGGAVNPVPYDVLLDMDVVVAVDVTGGVPLDKKGKPNMFDAVLNTFTIMQRTMIDEKLELVPPDIYLKVDTTDIELLGFSEGKELFERCEETCTRLRSQLEAALGEPAKKGLFGIKKS